MARSLALTHELMDEEFEQHLNELPTQQVRLLDRTKHESLTQLMMIIFRPAQFYCASRRPCWSQSSCVAWKRSSTCSEFSPAAATRAIL